MTITELKKLMTEHHLPMSRLNALSNNCFSVLSKISYHTLQGFIDDSICPNGYHDGGLGENPFGLNCGECGEQSCLNCSVWKELTMLCVMFNIRYKCKVCTKACTPFPENIEKTKE